MIMGAACGFAGAYFPDRPSSARCAAFSLERPCRRSSPSHPRTRRQSGRDRACADDPRHRSFWTYRRGICRPRSCRPPNSTCRLTERPVAGRILFGEDPFVYFSIALIVAIWLFLYRTRPGLCCAPSATITLPRTHSATRCSSSPVGGVVRRRLRRACRGFPAARLYAVLHSGNDGGARLDRAGAGGVCFVAAGGLVAGAYLFGAVTFLQLRAQALGLGIPSQLMSSLPYLATVVVLVLISRTRGTAGSAAPASLGLVFVPDR